MKYAGVNAFLAGVRPCVVAMILATACTMGLSTLGGFTTLVGGFAPDMRALAVFALLGILHFAYKKKTQKAPSPHRDDLTFCGAGRGAVEHLNRKERLTK